MKLYKRLAMIVIAAALLLSMTGCIIIPVSKYYDISAEEVVSVQFYDLRDDTSARYSGFDAMHQPVYTLPEEENQEFLTDFSKLKFSDTILIVLAAVDPSFTYGKWVVRINFTDGNYTFYSCSGYGETYDSEGSCISATHFSCEDEELESLIRKYYETE